jgi:hypothetical protein
MTSTIKETVEYIQKLIDQYREYDEVYDYAYRNAHFSRSDNFMSNLEDNMSDVLSDLSDSFYDLFLEDNNLDKNDYKTIDKIRFVDDIIRYISNDYSDLDLNLPEEWLNKIIDEYFRCDFIIVRNMLQISC